MCNCYFGVDGVCLRCQQKRPDHDELLSKIRPALVERAFALACETESFALLDKAADIEQGVRIEPTFMVLPGLLDEILDETLGNRSRRQEFEVALFRVWDRLSNDPEEMFAFVLDRLVYQLGADRYSAQAREHATRLAQGERVELTEVARCIFAAATQDAPYVEPSVKESWFKRLFTQTDQS